MIYDATLVEELSPENIYRIAAGRLLGFRVTLEEMGSITIHTQHIAQTTQDHSLRVWVSEELAGRSITAGSLAKWHPNRTPNEIVTLYDQSLTAPDRLAIAAQPGDYIVNVLNLVNTPNGFVFRLTERE